MARERFDDVVYRIVQEPEPTRSPRRFRHRALGVAVVLIAAGGLLAGAARRPTGVLSGWHNAPHMHYGAAGIPPAADGGPGRTVGPAGGG